MLASIAAHLPLEHHSDEHWLADGRVTRDGSRYRLDLVMRGPRGEARRTASAATCAAIADLAALLVALALNPDAARRAASESPTAPTPSESERTTAETGAANSTRSEPQAPPRPVAARKRDGALETRRPPPPPEDAQAASEQPTRPDFGLSLALALDSGMLPSAPAFGIEPHGELRYGRSRAGVGLGLWLAGRETAGNYPSASLEGRALLGRVSFGFELLNAPLLLVPCVVLERGVLVVEAQGITSAESESLTWTAVGAGLQAAYRLAHRVEVALAAQALAPLTRPRGRVGTPGGDVEVFESKRVTIRATAGVTYVFR